MRFCSKTKIKTKDMNLAVFPEGPIAFNGNKYCYSKGERLYLDNLAKDFKSLTIISFVFRKDDPDYIGCAHSEFESQNINVIELPFNALTKYSILGKFIHFTKVFFAIFKAVKGIDVLYLFLPSYPSAMACFIGKIKKIPYFVYVADDWEQASPCMFKWDNLRDSFFYKCFLNLNCWLERFIGKKSLFSVTAGSKSLEKFKTFGCPVTETIPRITLSKNNIYLREDTCQNNEIIIINVGILVYDKAQHILIESFSNASKIEPRLRLKIIGDGPKREELEALVQKLEIADKVTFTGYILEEDLLYEHYHKADIFVLSSLSEGFPRVLYEAMAMSLPIITTDCGGISNLMENNKNAIVVEVGNAKVITDGILDIINDSNKRKQFISNGLTTVTNVLEKADPKQIKNMLEKYW